MQIKCEKVSPLPVVQFCNSKLEKSKGPKLLATILHNRTYMEF